MAVTLPVCLNPFEIPAERSGNKSVAVLGRIGHTVPGAASSPRFRAYVDRPYPRAGIFNPRCTAGRASPRSSQAATLG
jgi:hypothetical protein